MSVMGISLPGSPDPQKISQQPIRFLYLGDKKDGAGLKLEAAINDAADNVDAFIPGAKDLLDSMIGKDLNEILSGFNKRIIGGLEPSNKIEVNPTEYPKDGEVLKPAKGDYLGPEAKGKDQNIYVGNGTKTDPWQNIMKIDGKTFPLSVLRGGMANKLGIPEVMILQKDSKGKMELEPLGEKDGKPFYFYNNVPYIDANTGKEKKGMFYKFRESTNDGKSGINGVIVPEELVPHVVVEAEEITKEEYEILVSKGKAALNVGNGLQYFAPKKAYFTGVKESQKLIDERTNFHIDISA